MALPLHADAARTTSEVRVAQARSAPYTLMDAFFYVFRGRGVYVFGSYLAVLVVLAVLGLLPILGVAAGCLSFVFVAAVLFLIPSTLALIVRTTASGDNELPDWPDFSAYGQRLLEIGGFLLTGLVAALPLGLLVRVTGCGDYGMLGATCLLVLCGGWFVALALWAPSFGALSLTQNALLAFRLDLHAKVLATFGSEVWIMVLLSTFLVVAGQVLALLMTALPILGLAASAAVGMYGWFTAAHLIGLFFRRNARELSQIYGQWR